MQAYPEGIDVASQAADPASLLSSYRTLIRLRSEHPALATGDWTKVEASDPAVAAFLRHILQRADWTRDLHFQTRTTMDTLDYSGTGINAGSKVIVAAAGAKKRELATELPRRFQLPECPPSR